MKQDMIVILDLGSTENTVIARQIRDLGVYSEIHPHDITAVSYTHLVMRLREWIPSTSHFQSSSSSKCVSDFPLTKIYKIFK